MGELEKRINATLKQIAFINFYQQDFATQTIKNIVEEMRREFPDYLMFDSDYSKSDPYITHQKWTLDTKNAFLKTERDKWFEKWFSKEEEI